MKRHVFCLRAMLMSVGFCFFIAAVGTQAIAYEGYLYPGKWYGWAPIENC